MSNALSKVGDLRVTGNVRVPTRGILFQCFTQLSEPESSPEPVTSPSDGVRPAVCGSSVPRSFKNTSQGRGGTAGRRRHPRANEGSPGLPKVAAAALHLSRQSRPRQWGGPALLPVTPLAGSGATFLRGLSFPFYTAVGRAPSPWRPSCLTPGLPARGSSAAHPAQAVPAVSGP